MVDGPLHFVMETDFSVIWPNAFAVVVGGVLANVLAQPCICDACVERTRGTNPAVRANSVPMKSADIPDIKQTA